MTITPNRNFFCWPTRIRTYASAFRAQYSSIELKASSCATFRFELKTSILCLPPRKGGRWLCCRYTRPHSFVWLSPSRWLSKEPCSSRPQRNALPDKLETTFAVRTVPIAIGRTRDIRSTIWYVSRYTNEPFKSSGATPATCYLTLNAAGSSIFAVASV